MHPPQTSTADIALPYEASENGGHFQDDQAERLTRAEYRHKGVSEQKEALFGTTLRSMKEALAGSRGETRQPLFGNRLRWVARTFRDAKERRDS